jgi:hypothetical protein
MSPPTCIWKMPPKVAEPRRVAPGSRMASSHRGQPCPGCGWPFQNLETHFYYSPACRPKDAPASRRDGAASARLFAHNVRALLDEELWDAHTNHFIKIAHIEAIRTVLISVARLVTSFVAAECSAEEAAGGLSAAAVQALCVDIMNTMYVTPSAEKIVRERKRELLHVEPRLRGPEHDPKKAVSFSIVQLLAVALTESKAMRMHVLKASELWKSGDLHQKKPKIYADVTDAERFRSSDMCKKATPTEANDLRIALHLWVRRARSRVSTASAAQPPTRTFECRACCRRSRPLPSRRTADSVCSRNSLLTHRTTPSPLWMA